MEDSVSEQVYYMRRPPGPGRIAVASSRASASALSHVSLGARDSKLKYSDRYASSA